MRLLVLGGTVFLSRAVAAEAVARGHQVVCACRGRSGAVPDGATLVELDRDRPLPVALARDGAFDAVVDVARRPSWVRRAVAALPDAHWVFVSTMNVYADDSVPHGTPDTLALREPQPEDVPLDGDSEAYGRMKVACEQAVLEAAGSASVVRPGLIVGPGDPSGRFAYWPRRLSRVGEAPEVLGPGDPADLMQVVDVRDLAAWLVDLAEQRRAGVWDATGPAVPIAELLHEVAVGAGVRAGWTWVPQESLLAAGVEPWSGPDAIPLWLPRPEYDGLPAHDVSDSLAAGLTIRPLAETTRDVLAWLEEDPDAPVGGIGLDRERELLDTWHEGGGAAT